MNRGDLSIWPRHYAAQILAAQTKEEQLELFNAVPEHLRELVRDHCYTARSLAHGRRGIHGGDRNA